jgi:hypothetical protein
VTQRRSILILLVICLGLLLSTKTALARQSPVERELDGAKALYTEGRLDEAVTALRRVISTLNQLRDQQSRKLQLADAHFHLGLSYFALRDESSALENFRQVVALDPARTLDTEIYSPRIINLYAQARADVRPPPIDAPAKPNGPGDAEAPAAALRLGAHYLQAGTRVRLWLEGNGGTVKGNLVALNDHTFSLVSGENQNLSFPRDTVTRIDVVKERHRHWLAGMIIGASFGAALGAVETPGCGGNDGDCYTRGENIGYGALGAGIVGALVGALYQTEEWVEVPFGGTSNPIPRMAGRGTAVSFVWRY